MRNQRKAYLFGLAAVVLWSTVASAFKLSLEHLGPAQLVCYASVTSAIALGVVVAARGLVGEALRVARKQAGQSLLMGLMNPFVYYLVLFGAYDRLPAQEAQPLNYTWALMLALLSIPLLRQRVTRWDILGGAICYSGVWVIATRGRVFDVKFENPVGVALALGSSVIWALYWILNTRSSREPTVGLFLNFLFGLPFVIAYCLLSEGLSVPMPGLAGAAYVGLFEMGVTFLLWSAALRHSENTARVGNLIFLSPFLSLWFIHFLVGESILASTYVGLVLIVAGLVVQQFKARRSSKPA